MMMRYMAFQSAEQRPAHFLDPPVAINYRGKLFLGNFCPKIA